MPIDMAYIRDRIDDIRHPKPQQPKQKKKKDVPKKCLKQKCSHCGDMIYGIRYNVIITSWIFDEKEIKHERMKMCKMRNYCSKCFKNFS
jgi:hypothetical protein